MRLYAGSSKEFVHDAIQNQIAVKLKSAFFDYFRYNPSPQEESSWKNSLRAMCLVLQHSRLDDHAVILEYQLPLTSKRLDFMICGKDASNADNAVITELKQWEKCEESDTEGTVVTWLGGQLREMLHPSVQVGQYAMYLQDFHTAFYERNPVQLNACSYLHNYDAKGDRVLYSDKFRETLRRYPIFAAEDVEKLSSFLLERLSGGRGVEVLKRVDAGDMRPSKKLMQHVASVIRGQKECVLLDEQLVAYERVLTSAKEGFKGKRKTVIIIKGGPGTGKSVIAINLMADMLLKGLHAQYATGSKAFTETLRRVIGLRGAIQFKYFNSYVGAPSNAVDVLVADEAHRIRETSNNRFTARAHRSKTPQIDELLNASKVGVFFIDDDQVVRPGEVGSSDMIRSAAEREGCKIYEYTLEAQFRCNGSDAFVNWVNNTLGIKRTANVIWETREEFDFQILSTPLEVERSIKARIEKGFTGRMTAGFCWEWSNPNDDGSLVNDVYIGTYMRPWNAKSSATRLAPGIPKEIHWAHDPNGFGQVGCIYTAQGFEFDYVGVIFGKDLTYDLDAQKWVGHPEESFDTVVKRGRDRFTDLVKNTYRVLLSRGMKGCYVCFLDKETERFVRSRVEDGPAAEH